MMGARRVCGRARPGRCRAWAGAFAVAWGLNSLAQVTSPGVAGQVPETSRASLTDQQSRANIFADPDWFQWGGTPVLGDDGLYHLFYSRHRRTSSRLMRGWLYESQIAHATAPKPEGPYRFQNIALEAPGDKPAGRWDAVNATNPCCVRLPDPDAPGRVRYYLYFVANRDDHSTFNDWYDHIVNQRIGVAESDSPDGPWSRRPDPVCAPAAPLLGYVVNPGVTRLPDGRFLMVLKGRQNSQTPGATGDTMGAYLQGWALADRPTGPFVIQPTLLFPAGIPAEDPCVFVWDGRIYAAVKDWKGLLSGTPGIAWIYGTMTADGSIAWRIPEPRETALMSPRSLTWSDGAATVLNTLERPFIVQDATGRPTYLIAAAAVQDPFLGATFDPLTPARALPSDNLPFVACIPLVSRR